VPLNFLRRKKADESVPAVAAPTRSGRPMRTGVAFDAVTEEWRLIGRMSVEGRLSDALNSASRSRSTTFNGHRSTAAHPSSTPPV